MKPETKLYLMKQTDSYWTLFPVVVKEKVLQYKDSQELSGVRVNVTAPCGSR